MKKGFTLVELLAVIALVALLIGFAMPAILERINSERGKLDDALNSTVMAASSIYVRRNSSKFSDEQEHYFKFKTLVEDDLLDESILTNYNNYCVKATYANEQYSFEVVTSCVEG